MPAPGRVCPECNTEFKPRTNAVTCSPDCARKRKLRGDNEQRRRRYAANPSYRAKACAASAEYRQDMAFDADYVEKERQRNARRQREKRSDPIVRARDVARTAEYLREKRLADPIFRERDNARRSKAYHARRDESAFELLELLNRGELAAMGHPCFVYLFYDVAGALLYAGVTNDPKRRLYQHARDKDWFGEICVAKLAPFQSETEAMSAEAILIRALRPLHNVQHNGGCTVADGATADKILLRFASVDMTTLNEMVA